MAHDDPGFVARQYGTADNLNARVCLHERFSTNPRPWQRWVFDGFDLPAGANILDVGCGPGNLWHENEDRLPAGCTIALADTSEGMLGEARTRAGGDGRYAFHVADAGGLPFEAAVFDAVICNHMLYHLPDRDPALSEIARVLKEEGILYAATNGQGAHREMGWMQRVLDPTREDDRYFQTHLSFSLENGEEQLSRWFEEVSLRRYEDALAVTEARPILDCLLSGSAADAAREKDGLDELGRRANRLEGLLEAEISAHGEIRITKDSGVFVARGAR